MSVTHNQSTIHAFIYTHLDRIAVLSSRLYFTVRGSISDHLNSIKPEVFILGVGGVRERSRNHLNTFFVVKG